MKIQISLSGYIEDSNIGQVLLKYRGHGYYVHFTNQPKLGVKPTKIHADPHAIYFYPVDWIINSEGRTNAHGQKQSLYLQYGTTFKYYYIVSINKSSFGINVSNVDDQDAIRLMRKFNVYDHKRANIRTQLPGEILYGALRDANVQQGKRFPKEINWIEDEGDGIVNPHEPYQLMVRNPKIIKVLDFGLTKTDRAMSTQLQNITKNLGKPFSVKSVRDVSKRLKQVVIEYKKANYKSFVITLYERLSSKSGYDIVVETSYSEWIINAHYNGPASAIRTNLFKLERDDPSKLLQAFILTKYKKYNDSDRLVEESLSSDWRQEYLRKDIENFSIYLDVNNKNYCERNNITNKFLCEYISDRFTESLNNITNKKIENVFPLANRDNFEVFAVDYNDFQQMPQRSSVKKWAELKSLLPSKRFYQFKHDFMLMAGEFLSSEQIAEIIKHLEDT